MDYYDTLPVMFLSLGTSTSNAGPVKKLSKRKWHFRMSNGMT